MMSSGRLPRPVFAVFCHISQLKVYKASWTFQHSKISQNLRDCFSVLAVIWFYSGDRTYSLFLAMVSWMSPLFFFGSRVGVFFINCACPLVFGLRFIPGVFLGNPRIGEGLFTKSGRTMRKKKVQFILYYSINENTSIPTAGAWIHFTSGNFRWRFTKKWQFLGKLGVYWGERAAAQWLLEFWGYTHRCFSFESLC